MPTSENEMHDCNTCLCGSNWGCSWWLNQKKNLQKIGVNKHKHFWFSLQMWLVFVVKMDSNGLVIPQYILGPFGSSNHDMNKNKYVYSF
jgi:hypothetical protein